VHHHSSCFQDAYSLVEEILKGKINSIQRNVVSEYPNKIKGVSGEADWISSSLHPSPFLPKGRHR
jgi:hypothetical protein